MHSENEPVPPEEWHREVINERWQEFEGREEEIGLTLDQVWEEVDRRLEASSG